MPDSIYNINRKKSEFFHSKASLDECIESYFDYVKGEFELRQVPGKKSTDEPAEEKVWLREPEPATISGLAFYLELERILKNTKKMVRLFLLTPRDIAELNLLIPVYLQQDSAYYYINKIDAWQKGKPTKVELVKLG